MTTTTPDDKRLVGTLSLSTDMADPELPGQPETLRPGWVHVSIIDGHFRLRVPPTRKAQVWFDSRDSLWRWHVLDRTKAPNEVAVWNEVASFTAPLATADAAMREVEEFVKGDGDR